MVSHLIGGGGMTNEEFQKIVLEKLENVENRLGNLEEKLEKLEDLEEKFEKFQEEQIEFKKTVNGIHEQTVELTEFRHETNEKLNRIIEDNKSIYEIIGEHEVSIRSLRRISV